MPSIALMQTTHPPAWLGFYLGHLNYTSLRESIYLSTRNVHEHMSKDFISDRPIKFSQSQRHRAASSIYGVNEERRWLAFQQHKNTSIYTCRSDLLGAPVPQRHVSE